MFQYHLALPIGALVFLAPFLVLTDRAERDLLVAYRTINLEDVDELLNYVTGDPDSQLAWTLEWTIFLPFIYAPSTEQLATCVTLLWLSQNFETNPAKQLVTQLLVHEAILDTIEVITTRVVLCAPIRIVVHVYLLLIHYV